MKILKSIFPMLIVLAGLFMIAIFLKPAKTISTDFDNHVQFSSQVSGHAQISRLSATNDQNDPRYRQLWNLSDQPVIKGSDVGYDQVRNLTILKDTNNRAVKEDGKYIGYFFARIIATGEIDSFRAESSDLTHWSNFQKVLGHNGPRPDELYAGITSAIKFGPSDYRFWYNSKQDSLHQMVIGFAISTDGVHLTKQGPAVKGSDLPIRDSGDLGIATVDHLADGNYSLFAEGGSNGWHIYGFISSDAKNWKPMNNSKPVIDTDLLSQWERFHVADPNLMELPDGTYVIEYNGASGLDGKNAEFQIGFATAKNIDGPFVKDKANPIIGRNLQPANYGVETSAWLLDETGKQWIHFVQQYSGNSTTSSLYKSDPILSTGILLQSLSSSDIVFLQGKLNHLPFIASSKSYIGAGRDSLDSTLVLLGLYDFAQNPYGGSTDLMAKNSRIEIDRYTHSSQTPGDLEIYYWGANQVKYSWNGASWAVAKNIIPSDLSRPVDTQLIDDGANFIMRVRYADDNSLITEATVAKSAVKPFKNNRWLLAGDPFTDRSSGQLFINSLAVEPYSAEKSNLTQPVTETLPDIKFKKDLPN